MHICMLTDYFLPDLLGGTERAVYEIGRRLVKKGHQLTVITLDVHNHQKRSQIEGMDIHRLQAVSITKLVGAQLTVSPFALSESSRIIRSVRPDIIHAHNLYFNLTAIAPIAKRQTRLPLVTTLHLPRMSYGRKLLDFIIRVYQNSVGQAIVRFSDRLIVVSESVHEHTIADLRASPSKVSCIPNGVDSRMYVPSSQRPERPTITHIARLVHNKGPQYLIEAAPELLKKHPEVEINIVGNGPLEHALKSQVKLQGLQKRIHFLGTVESVLPVLHSTSIFVRPSLTEGMSLAILEAMACGLPVVASNIGGNAEIIRDRETGYLFQPTDAKGLSKAIDILLSNPETAQEIGYNARKEVERRFDWERIAERTIEVYESIK